MEETPISGAVSSRCSADYYLISGDPVRHHTESQLLNYAYRLAVAHQRTVYDSLYLALSEQEQCQFVTADARFFNAIRASFPNVVWLANWP